MSLFERCRSVDLMADLLARERNAILSGQFSVLVRLLTEKERLAKKLSKSEVDPAVLGDLKTMAMRNETLLGAARYGLERAKARIGALGTVRPDLHTYDASGCRTSIGKTARQEDRRR